MTPDSDKLNDYATLLLDLGDSQPEYAYTVPALRAGVLALRALAEIRDEVSGKEWSPETIETVASIIQATGLVVIEDYEPDADDEPTHGTESPPVHDWSPWFAGLRSCAVCGSIELLDEHMHVWGKLPGLVEYLAAERSNLAGTLHRKCAGCEVVSLDGDSDDDDE